MRRKQLGAELRRLRREVDVTMEHAASVLDCARSRIGHIENGRNSIRKPELKVLLDLYGVDGDAQAALEDLRQEASKRGWWSTYRLPSWLLGYVGLESDASTMRSFEGELIPGLLQTEAYSRRIHVVAEHMAKAEEVEKLVAARQHRQQRLTAETAPLDLAAVVAEAAFRRAMGEPEVGREQLDHVAELAQRPNIAVHVLLDSTGLHPSMSGSFTVLGFASGALPAVGYQEYAVGGHLVDDQDAVARLSELWEVLRSRALGKEESIQWIRQQSRES